MEFNQLEKSQELALIPPFELTAPPKPIIERKTKKQPKKLKSGNREENIKNCEQCLGNPEIEPLNVPGFTGTKCAKCMEVIQYVVSTS